MLQGCAETPFAPPVYVVKPRDTVYSIAWRYGLDFRDLASWNNIGSDFHISVGQTLSLTPRRTARTTMTRPPRAPSPKTPIRSAPNVGGIKFDWPTDRSGGTPRPVPGGGVLLAGQLGQDIRAASAGRVVYTGSGIRGYGNLIIIKHGETWLSAYAHNRDSLVRNGQEVSAGELIAHMGEGAPNKPVLYFEIRRDGKPVDPLRFLSR